LVKFLDDDGNEIKIVGGNQSVSITFQIGCIITVRDGQQVVLVRFWQESARNIKNARLYRGLPRVAELFEARSPKMQVC